MPKARVHSVETMGALDGPGLRYVLFLSGCPFRCAFCHNPDTWANPPAAEKSADEVVADVKKYAEFFKFSGGGITVSGGEPFLQAEFLAELFGKLRADGISTCADTCGGVELSVAVRSAVDRTDIFLLDIKHVDEDAHKEITGQPFGKTRKFLDYISSLNKRVWIRQVLLENITATPQYAEKLADFLKPYPVEKVELLPYHDMGKYKWEKLGLEYKLETMQPPTTQAVDEVRKILAERGFNAQ